MGENATIIKQFDKSKYLIIVKQKDPQSMTVYDYVLCDYDSPSPNGWHMKIKQF